MTTYELSVAQRSASRAVRQTNPPVVLLLVVLIVSGVGLIGHAGERAAQHRAERLAHARAVAQRVDALATDWQIEQSFLRSASARARAEALASVAAQRAAAEAAWTAEQQRVAESARRAALADAGTVWEAGEATLRSLPGNAGVEIHWDDPDLGGHLGGVWSGSTSYIMVNAQRLAGNPAKTGDVVRHEIAHIYEGRLAAAAGLSWSALNARMSAAFGSSATERAADCVALRFGATWTHYTSDCSSADKQAWVDGMIGGYLP